MFEQGAECEWLTRCGSAVFMPSMVDTAVWRLLGDPEIVSEGHTAVEADVALEVGEYHEVV